MTKFHQICIIKNMWVNILTIIFILAMKVRASYLPQWEGAPLTAEQIIYFDSFELPYSTMTPQSFVTPLLSFPCWTVQLWAVVNKYKQTPISLSLSCSLSLPTFTAQLVICMRGAIFLFFMSQAMLHSLMFALLTIVGLEWGIYRH